MLQAITIFNFKENQETKLEKVAKTLVSDPILVHLVQIWAANIFFQKSGFASLKNLMILS